MFQEAIQRYNEKSAIPFSPKVVLFDMDGVLYDSMPNHAQVWMLAMKAHGIRFSAKDAYATEGARGVDTIQKYAKEQLKKDLSEEEAEAIYELKAGLFHELLPPPIFDGVKDLMRKIKADGLRIGVVTGSGQRKLIQRLLDDFSDFLSEDQITTAFDVKRGKPNPDPYLAGLKRAGNYASNEGIVIENAPLGVRAGVAARCFTIAVNSGPLPNSALTDEGADILFPSIRQLADSWEQLIR